MRLGPAEPLVTALAAAAIRLLAGTWRYRVRGWEHVVAARATGRPIIYVLWHSRILPLLYHRRDQGMAFLISRHPHGRHLAPLTGPVHAGGPPGLHPVRIGPGPTGVTPRVSTGTANERGFAR